MARFLPTGVFYDSVYTERYMQTPQENANGYDDNSPINHVNKLKGKFFLYTLRR
jgi:dipeptidyl-peptidase-4